MGAAQHPPELSLIGSVGGQGQHAVCAVAVHDPGELGGAPTDDRDAVSGAE
jgi:hypothetical protein